jgi:superfamily II DNA or RNA helicase
MDYLMRRWTTNGRRSHCRSRQTKPSWQAAFARSWRSRRAPTRATRTPRPYQSDALAAWIASDSRGVVVLPTGAGKTILALMAIERMGLRTLVVVPTIELLYQWRDAAIERLGLPKSKVGVVGDGRRELRPITIITYASAAMPDAPIGGTGLLICDEAHHLPSPSYSAIPARCGAPYRLGITATPDRSDGTEDGLYKLIGPLIYQRTAADLSAEGHLAK